MNKTEKNDVFGRLESNVRSYCRAFPDVFMRAEGSWLITRDGRRILDLLSGAGALNYGHNNPAVIEPVKEYISNMGIIHSLDLHTEAKERFIEVFEDVILRPRELDYRFLFPGPTGTNAVEASLKTARTHTGRSHVAAFTRGFHGMTLGSLAASSNPAARRAAGTPLEHVEFWPFDGEGDDPIATLDKADHALESRQDQDKPAAFLLELVQGEGGLACASASWLKRLVEVARRHGILIIVDDVQAGCGRTGDFFSFEAKGIEPDIVVLSKSLSGFGSPFSLVLMRPELDVWGPGEHNGTFRGNNLAFVGATAAITTYWATPEFSAEVKFKAATLKARLEGIAGAHQGLCALGRGLMQGLRFSDPADASACSRALYERSIMAETCGESGAVLKLLPALTMEIGDLEAACLGIGEVVQDRLHSRALTRASI